jgi:hypothetical protein
MNKLLALTATVLLASTASAFAATTYQIGYTADSQSCTATVTLFDDRSDGITKNVIAGLSEDDSCFSAIGLGLIGKVTAAPGKVENGAIIGVRTSAFPYPIALTLQYPFKTGNKYAITYTTNGTSITVLAAGTYTVK